MSTIQTAIRESIVLLLGLAVVAAASAIIGDAGDGASLAVAIVMPIGFCLFRAAVVRPACWHISGLRRLGYKIVVAAALVLLLVFEMGVEMFFGAGNLPIEVWVILAATGAAYLLLFCLAQYLGCGRAELHATTPPV